MGRCIPRPVSDDIQIFLFPGREQEQHADAAKTLGGFRLRKVIGRTAYNLVGLRAIERPGLAVAPQHRNLHSDRLGFALDGKLEQAIGCLCRGKDFPQLDTRINVGQFLSINRFDNLVLLEFPGCCGRRTFLDVTDLHNKCRLE